jgi:hypothetical protein
VNDSDVILNTDQANYMVLRSGRISGSDLSGNVFVTRFAGDTTDSSVLTLPKELVMNIDAGSEFYCITKKDKSLVNRENLDLSYGKTGKAGVMCVFDGTVSVTSQDETKEIHRAPAFVPIKSTDYLNNEGCKFSWVILID